MLEKAGDLDGAVADLDRSWRIYQQALHSASTAEVWRLHGDASATLERTVALLVSRPDKAFAAAEQAHSFALGATGLTSLRLPELLEHLPERVTMLHLSRVGSQVATWALERGRSTFSTLPLTDDAMRDLIGGFDRPRVERKSQRILYDALIAPLERWMTPDHSVVVVVDPELAAVPFAELRSPDGRTWIEARSFSTAPSATAFLHASAAAGSLPTANPHVLVLSDPLTSTAWSYLPPLRRARAEGETVASLYRDVVHLHGEAATKARFLAAVEKADVIHIASHAVSNGLRPDVSFLAVSPNADSGALYYPEIHRLKLRRAPLVILNACDTAAVSGSRTVATSTLAHAFLAAGARAVVGTRRLVGDATAERFSAELHRRLARGEPVVTALRAVQIQMLQDDVDEWSAYELIGAIDAGV